MRETIFRRKSSRGRLREARQRLISAKSSSLARHRRIHTGKRPYKCPYPPCDKRYVSSRRLLLLAKFKSFCRKTTMNKHAKRAHRLEGEEYVSDNEEELGSESEGETEDSPLSTTTPFHPPVNWSHPRPFGAPPAYRPDLTALQRSHSMDQLPIRPEQMSSFTAPAQVPTHRGSYPNNVPYANPLMMHHQERVPSINSEHSRSNSQVSSSYQGVVPINQIQTTMPQEYQSHQLSNVRPPNIKTELSVSGPAQLIAASQTMQSSPSTLSSNQPSPPNSAHPHEMYYSQVQQPLQNFHVGQSPVENHGPYPQYQQMQAQMSMPQQHPHQNAISPTQNIPMQQPYHGPPNAQPPPQQMYYDQMEYHEPVAAEVRPQGSYQQQRVYSISGPPMEEMWKHEDPSMITPSARAAQGMHY
jgi:metal regulatory transcription factor 1